jgi:hypothetical protein
MVTAVLSNVDVCHGKSTAKAQTQCESSMNRTTVIELNTRDFFRQNGGKKSTASKRQVVNSQPHPQWGSKLAGIACEFAATVATVLVMLVPVPFAVLIGLPVFDACQQRVLWRALSSALAVEVTVVVFVLFCSLSDIPLGVAYFLLALTASVLLLESMILKHSSK